MLNDSEFLIVDGMLFHRWNEPYCTDLRLALNSKLHQIYFVKWLPTALVLYQNTCIYSKTSIRFYFDQPG